MPLLAFVALLGTARTAIVVFHNNRVALLYCHPPHEVTPGFELMSVAPYVPTQPPVQVHPWPVVT